MGFKNRIRELPEKLRLKIWRIENEEEFGELLNLESSQIISSMLEKTLEADRKMEEHKMKIRENYGLEITEEYVWTLPEPVILDISREELEKTNQNLLEKLIEKPLIIKYNNKAYKIVLEYPCG